MPRTDENGRGLQAVLSYLLDRSIPGTEILTALGIARRTYSHRNTEDNFPDAEECRRIAGHFGLNPLDMMHRFGLITSDEIETFMNVVPLRSAGRSTTKVRKLDADGAATPHHGRRLSDLPRREGMPRL